MKMLKLKREENFECGLIDLDKLHEDTIDNVYINKETPEILVNYFKRHHDKNPFFGLTTSGECYCLVHIILWHLMLSYN